MFRGQFKHTIDEKSRLSIPVKFREALESTFRGPLYVTTLQECLVAYPADEWYAFEAKLNAMSKFDPKVVRLRRAFYAPAQECPLDKAGRILVPPTLRERAGLVRDVVIAGMGSTFEIWDSAKHESMTLTDSTELDSIFAEAGELGL